MKIFNIFLLLTILHAKLVVSENKTSGKIIGGVDAQLKEFPFIVQIYTTDYSYVGSIIEDTMVHGRFTCGASYLKDIWVLTAAHCVSSSPTSPPVRSGDDHSYLLKMGTRNLYDNFQIRYSRKIIIHDGYIANMKRVINDIALIQIDSPFTPVQSKVATIRIGPDETENLMKKLGKVNVKISGWGITDPNFNPHFQRGQASEILQMAITKAIKCDGLSLTNPKDAELLICVGRKIPCFGDSGGPLVYKGNLIGVTSFGLGCGSVIAAYANIWKYTTWLENKMALYKSSSNSNYVMLNHFSTIIALYTFSIKLYY